MQNRRVPQCQLVRNSRSSCLPVASVRVKIKKKKKRRHFHVVLISPLRTIECFIVALVRRFGLRGTLRNYQRVPYDYYDERMSAKNIMQKRPLCWTDINFYGCDLIRVQNITPNVIFYHIQVKQFTYTYSRFQWFLRITL